MLLKQPIIREKTVDKKVQKTKKQTCTSHAMFKKHKKQKKFKPKLSMKMMGKTSGISKLPKWNESEGYQKINDTFGPE